MSDDDIEHGSRPGPVRRIDPSALAHFETPEDWTELLTSLGTDRTRAEILTEYFRERAEEENRRRKLLCSDPRLRETLHLDPLDPTVFTRGLELYLTRRDGSRGQEAS